jgi:hypothetical protein
MLIMRLKSSNKAIKSKVHKPFVVLIYMIVCTCVPPWILLDLLQWKTQCLFTCIRSCSVSHYFPVESQKLCFSRTGFVYVKNWKNSENRSISQLCFLFVIYLRFIITFVKGMFNLQIDKKKQKHMVKIFYMWMLCINIKRKKYKTFCAELEFAKSPSTEWSWLCIELIIFFFICYAVGLLQYSKSVWSKAGTLTVYIDIM